MTYRPTFVVMLWKNLTSKGFWHKRIVQALELTNYNVILNNLKNPLNEIDNVIVSDTYTISHGNHMTVGTGSYYNRVYMGFSNSHSKSLDTVMFMQKGILRMRFTNISDPQSLACLANYEIRQQKGVTAEMQAMFSK